MYARLAEVGYVLVGFLHAADEPIGSVAVVVLDAGTGGVSPANLSAFAIDRPPYEKHRNTAKYSSVIPDSLGPDSLVLV
jgi:hypothetical protein